MSISELQAKITEYKDLQRMSEELAAEMEAVKDAIKGHMDAEQVDTLTAGPFKVTYKPVTSSRLDTAALKKAAPELVERFTKTTKTRRFCVA